MCDPTTVVAELPGLSAFTGNDDIRLDLISGSQLAAQGTTCLQECQASTACVAFAEASNAEYASP